MWQLAMFKFEIQNYELLGEHTNISKTFGLWPVAE